MACAVLLVGILVTRPDLPKVLAGDTYWFVGPSWANAIDGETLMLEQGQIVVLLGIKALRPDQTCSDADGVIYACGHQATTYLQSIVQDRRLYAASCTTPNLGACVPLDEGNPLPETLEDFLHQEQSAGEDGGGGPRVHGRCGRRPNGTRTRTRRNASA